MRTHRVHIPLLLTAAIALGGAPSASASTVCASADAVPFAISTAKLASAASCLVNQERARYRLPSFRLNHRLAQAATGHASDMVSRDYFSHDTSGGGSFVDRILKSGYTSRNAFPSLGEDLAWGSGALGSARSIVDAWMSTAQRMARRALEKASISPSPWCFTSTPPWDFTTRPRQAKCFPRSPSKDASPKRAINSVDPTRSVNSTAATRLPAGGDMLTTAHPC